MRKQKDKSENVNVLSLTIPSIESLVVAIQKLQCDIIATPIDVEKLTKSSKIQNTGHKDPYLKTDGNTSAPPPNGTLLSCREVKKIHSKIMTMSHWDASERGNTGEKGVHTLGTYVKPPVPTNVDIQVKKNTLRD
jgi:hypothetical protein